MMMMMMMMKKKKKIITIQWNVVVLQCSLALKETVLIERLSQSVDKLSTQISFTLISYCSLRVLRIELQNLRAPTDALVYILCILILVCCYMFGCNRRLQGAYTYLVNKKGLTVIVHIKCAVFS